jgi:predicted nuclease of predicted toxin-antitoxin system
MRVLLDECVPRRIRAALPGHAIQTAAEAGLAGLRNGELLAAASPTFACFLTVDRNLQFQQNLAALPIAVIVLAAPNNRYETLLPLMPGVLRALAEIRPGELRPVGT